MNVDHIQALILTYQPHGGSFAPLVHQLYATYEGDLFPVIIDMLLSPIYNQDIVRACVNILLLIDTARAIRVLTPYLKVSKTVFSL